MKTLGRLDGFLGGHMAPVVLCCVALGIAFPEVLSHLNGVTVGLFTFMTFSNSLGGGFRELAQVVRHPLPVAVIFGLLHVVMPLITLGLGTLCFPDAPLFTIGLVLEYAVPTGVASLMWVGMSRGNTALCLSVVLLCMGLDEIKESEGIEHLMPLLHQIPHIAAQKGGLACAQKAGDEIHLNHIFLPPLQKPSQRRSAREGIYFSLFSGAATPG